MSTLNCKRTARVISLYLAGDLSDGAAGEVSAHLAACEECRRLAEEFSISSSLLAQACPPPEFAAEFYAGIRTAVLAEITREAGSTKLWFFQRPWLYATSFAALLIACLLLLQHFGRGPRPHDVAVGAPAVAVQTPRPTETVNPSTSPLTARTQPAPGKPEAPPVVHPRRAPRQLEQLRNPAAVTTQSAVNQSKQIRLGGESPVNIDSPVAGSQRSAGTAGLAAMAQMSRIEIQTSDPNIRIIWLTASESGPSENINHDQDQHGERK